MNKIWLADGWASHADLSHLSYLYWFEYINKLVT